MFESEATKFQTAGIQIGASSTHAEEQLLSESLAPFSISRRNSALEIARLYAVLHCFENEIREYIRETLADKEGIDWWTELPPKMKTCLLSLCTECHLFFVVLLLRFLRFCQSYPRENLTAICV